MTKTQPVLRIMGDRVRYFRKLKGLSQAELAKGICTQATISLIEKRNKVPSMNILMRIVSRLGVTLGDVVAETRNRTQQTLEEVEAKLRHGDYAEAAPLLAKLQVTKLDTEDEQKRYYYARGMVELFVNRAQDEAIYYFGRVLTPLTSNYRDITVILATLGLGLAYAEKGTTERAQVYMDQALKMLKEVALTESRYLDVELTIYWQIARIYYELKAYESVLQYVQTGIDLAVKHDSLFLLDELYALQARTLAKLGDQAAPATYQIALALAQITTSSGLLAALQEEASA